LTGICSYLKSAGAIEYIDENYAALHTFGDEHIVWNIDEFLKIPRTKCKWVALSQRLLGIYVLRPEQQNRA
jgi:hypothetical protein